jgi:hypothetical protein
VHSVLLHMHMLGVSGEAVIHRGDGTRVPLLVVPRYDFNWQRVYWLAKPVRFYPGDELSVTCLWDNSAANQPVLDGKQAAPTDVVWGEGTGDEMCVANLYVSKL